MAHSALGWLAAHPRESVSALLILCTCLAWETAASPCPDKKKKSLSGAPATPVGLPTQRWACGSRPGGGPRLLVFRASFPSWHSRSSQPASVPDLKPGLLFSLARDMGCPLCTPHVRTRGIPSCSQRHLIGLSFTSPTLPSSRGDRKSVV